MHGSALLMVQLTFTRGWVGGKEGGQGGGIEGNNWEEMIVGGPRR